ncbi:MAG: MogA/MoaB family molybdenum cofactor biosynthesis protein [Dehalococcoidales bacterium]|nr:MogA/MoaB family molybdenum cofactor biosynthesis protein [Dehalococcoidales bacterium]
MINTGIITVSDKGWHGQRQDKSSQVVKDSLSSQGYNFVKYDIVPDEADVIAGKLIEWADEGSVDIILTTGGTGLAQRDVTPEATLSVVDKVIPGITEAMRAKTFKVTPAAILSRAASGVRGRCLIINLPGSPKAVRECLGIIIPVIPHAIEIIKGEVTEHKAPDSEA